MGQLRVRDIMTTQVITLLGTDTVKDATITLAVDNLSGAPVVDDEYHYEIRERAQYERSRSPHVDIPYGFGH